MVPMKKKKKKKKKKDDENIQKIAWLLSISQYETKTAWEKKCYHYLGYPIWHPDICLFS